jgi:class I lanthipeptide synthase
VRLGPGQSGERAVTALAGPQAAGFFVLRTPLAPLTLVTDWSRGTLAGRRLDASDFEDVVAADRAELRARLEEIVTEAGFREAVYLASPALEAAIDQWRKDPDSDRGKRAENSLVAYLMRAAARPTPFGLFAGCTTGSIGARTQLRLAGRQSYRRHTRLDMDFLWTLANAIEADPRLRAGLRYWPNSSLHQVGDRLLYAEARAGQAGRSYHLVAADRTPYLAKVLARAAGGARLDELAAELTDDDVSEAEARAYLEQLIDSQLLVAGCQPAVTGAPPGAEMAATLARQHATAGIAGRLGHAQAALQALDDGGIGASPDRYRDVVTSLDGLPVSPDPARLVQVDLLTSASAAEVSPGVVAELLSAARLLHALAPARGTDTLAGFREQYVRRYGTREMPLAQVLDEESGIGFSATGQPSADRGPLLAGLPIADRRDRDPAWRRRDAVLHRKVMLALQAGKQEISLEPGDADALGGQDQLPLPDAFEVVATIAAESGEAVDNGAYQLLIGSVAGPSGARLLGRFCHADGQLLGLVREHLRAEERIRPDCVFAEVVHLPQGRTGNVLCRPVLRGYEIPYLGRSGAPSDRQLPLSDLLVSVRADRIVVRSRKLGREVVPRLSTAHNYAAGLGVYRFLCALQQQQVLTGVMWDWGPLRSSPFLPRVVSGRAVLSRMTWNLGEEELASFAGEAGAGLFRAVQQLRARLSLPRYVALADADNELLADLDNVLSVEALAHQVRRRTSASLVELWPGPDRLCVTGPEGRFIHQLVVPFAQPAPSAVADPVQPVQPQERGPQPGTAIRHFPPGSPWLYLKLFAGPATVDRLLLLIGPELSGWLSAGAIDGWHFLRYGDPEWHLRLRLHGLPATLLSEVLPRLERLTTPLLRTGELWRTQLDTYEPEVERYGGELAIGAAEQIFQADSEAALTLIGMLPGDAGAALRWQVALRGLDGLFDDLGVPLAQKRELARRCIAGYSREYAVDGAFQHAVAARFRQYRPRLADLLGGAAGWPADLAACLPVLAARSAAIAEPCAALRLLTSQAGEPDGRFTELALSLAHMHVNRLLRSAQRPQELVLYEMLDRIYASRSARGDR